MSFSWSAAIAVILSSLLAGCSDHAAEPDADSPDASAPDASAAEPDAGPPDAPLPCEPVDGSGCPPGQKCTLVPTGVSNPAFMVGCRELRGALGPFAGECGHTLDYLDDCGPGLFCYAGRELDGMYCRPLCHGDGDCPADYRCLWFVPGSVPTGFCARECTLFGACPLDSTCSRITEDADMTTFWMGCVGPGPLPVGEPCIDVYSCAANAYCWADACRALCDPAHPCAASTTCEALPGLRDGSGVCR